MESLSVHKLKKHLLILYFLVGWVGLVFSFILNVYIFGNSLMLVLSEVVPFLAISMIVFAGVWYAYTHVKLKQVFILLLHGHETISENDKLYIFSKLNEFPHSFYRFSLMLMAIFFLIARIYYAFVLEASLNELFFPLMADISIGLALIITIYTVLNRLFVPYLAALRRTALSVRKYSYYSKIVLVLVSLFIIDMSILSTMLFFRNDLSVWDILLTMLILLTFSLSIVRFTILEPMIKIRDISSQLKRIVKEDQLYEHAVLPITSSDEVGQLIDAYNKVLSRIESLYNIKLYSEAASRFVPKQFLHHLEKASLTEVQLGDQKLKYMTILFSDIRSFTVLSEQMTPEENIKFLNSFLSKMEPIINQNHGFIDKYIGDAIMALFDLGADDAVKAAINMLNELLVINEGRKLAGYQPIQIGIGINTGQMILGTIGGHSRMEGTVISDAVNLCSRLEELNKTYGTNLLISEFTLNSLKDITAYNIRLIDRVKVKGKTQPILIYEVFDADETELRELKKETMPLFAMALEKLEEGNPDEALGFFNQILAKSPNDHVTKYYVKHVYRRKNLRIHG